MSDTFATRWQPTPGAAIRQAATVVVLRQHDAMQMQVLLLRRNARAGDIHAGACVFPGGALDAADRLAHAHCSGLSDADASRRMKLPEGGLDFHVAALRECFEEAGLLYAQGHGGGAMSAGHHGQLAQLRAALNRGEINLAQLCEQAGLQLAPHSLLYFSHWLTPPGVPKRYDTRFFIARAPDQQIASHDNQETVQQLWVTPEEALDRRAELKLAPPTLKTFEWLLTLGDADGALRAAGALPEVNCIMPRLATGPKGIRPVLPDEPAWAELGHIDAEGTGRFRAELLPATPVPLSSRVVRVTANNGSMMTGPGTNSYFIGGGPENEWALLDPGPDDAAHVQALLAALPGKLRWIFVTHTHKDHSPATAAVKAATGAQVLGMAPKHQEWQDTSFAPDVALQGGEMFNLPGGTTLEVIHTPGHAGNHLCYRLHEERMLFTGDHVMQGSTVVINPPDGDMAAYIASLRELMHLDLDWLAPGHGFLMPQPRAAMQRIIDHRLAREAKVFAALREEAQPIAAVLATVYADVPAKLHAMALRSLQAHLYKLRDEARVQHEPPGHWRRVA